MKKINDVKLVGTYELRDGFCLDIMTYHSPFNSLYDIAEAWVYHKEYGIKQLVTGIEVLNDENWDGISPRATVETLLRMCEESAEYDIEAYDDEFMDH